MGEIRRTEHGTTTSQLGAVHAHGRICRIYRAIGRIPRVYRRHVSGLDRNLAGFKTFSELAQTNLARDFVISRQFPLQRLVAQIFPRWISLFQTAIYLLLIHQSYNSARADYYT